MLALFEREQYSYQDHVQIDFGYAGAAYQRAEKP